MPDIFYDYGAYKMTTADLKRKAKLHYKRARKFIEQHGIIGNNVDGHRANAFFFELGKRGEL